MLQDVFALEQRSQRESQVDLSFRALESPFGQALKCCWLCDMIHGSWNPVSPSLMGMKDGKIGKIPEPRRDATIKCFWQILGITSYFLH